MFGARSDLPNDPFLVAEAEGREVTSVMYVGYVDIAFNVMQRNFIRFGYKSS